MGLDSLGPYLIGCSVIIFFLAVSLIFLKLKEETGEFSVVGNPLEKTFKKTDSKTFKERRVFERVNIALNSTLSVPLSQNKLEGITRNISSRGMGISANTLPNVNTFVEIIINITNSENISTKGTVVWVKKPDNPKASNELGIRFEELITNEMMKIYKHIDAIRAKDMRRESL